ESEKQSGGLGRKRSHASIYDAENKNGSRMKQSRKYGSSTLYLKLTMEAQRSSEFTFPKNEPGIKEDKSNKSGVEESGDDEGNNNEGGDSGNKAEEEEKGDDKITKRRKR
ncbi:2177_t:CDS:2, partial [Dentiscutata heterogama]